jgi:hypothetical protein
MSAFSADGEFVPRLPAHPLRADATADPSFGRLIAKGRHGPSPGHTVAPYEFHRRPKEVDHCSLTTIREKLVKIGAKVVRHGRYVTFQLAEVTVPRSLFEKFRSLIDDQRRRPVPA